MRKTLFTFFCMTFIPASALADPAPDLAALIQEKKCAACHRFAKDDAVSAYPAPDLFYAGNKFQSKWLTGFLLKPEAIRIAGHITDPGFLLGQPETQGSHPALSGEEAEAMGAYLMSLKLEGLGSAKVAAGPLSKG